MPIIPLCVHPVVSSLRQFGHFYGRFFRAESGQVLGAKSLAPSSSHFLRIRDAQTVSDIGAVVSEDPSQRRVDRSHAKQNTRPITGQPLAERIPG